MRDLTATLRSLHGDRVGAAIHELHRAENDLAGALLRLADRHEVDHEILHVARDVAGWSQDHVRRLAEAGRGYGLDLDPGPEDDAGLLGRLRQKGSELTGRFHAPGLLLLADLRHLHTTAAGVSLDWDVLAQTALAVQDRELLELAHDCLAQTKRQVAWTEAKVKDTAAQVMVTG